MKISVVMASYLSEYAGSASFRGYKFERAVNSFLNQTHKDKELIIIADGCEKTEKIVSEKFIRQYPEIKCKKILKQPGVWSGNVRNEGLKIATGDIICYLDTDDSFAPNHLKDIDKQFAKPGTLHKYDWVYFDDVYSSANEQNKKHTVSLQFQSAGTSTIAHLNKLEGISWEGCDGDGHDWKFIQKLMSLYPNHTKIKGTGYLIHHLRNQFDF